MELNELRREIDFIDKELVSLFVQRMEVASKIADCKKANSLPIYQPIREQEKLKEVAQLAGLEMAEYVQDLYSNLFVLSRKYQEAHSEVF